MSIVQILIYLYFAIGLFIAIHFIRDSFENKRWNLYEGELGGSDLEALFSAVLWPFVVAGLLVAGPVLLILFNCCFDDPECDQDENP